MPSTGSMLEQAWRRITPLRFPTGRNASRRIVSVFLNIAFGQIATPYTRGSFADAEVNSDDDFGLVEIFSQSFEVATDGRAFFENIGVTETNRYLSGLNVRVKTLSHRHDHAAPIGIAAVDGSLY